METLILTIHILACISLIVLVLLQSGHEGMGVIFGGSSSTLFGSSGAGGFLSKVTVGVAVVFLLTSLTFTYIGAQQGKSPAESVIFQKTTPTEQQTSPKSKTAPTGDSEKNDLGTKGSGQQPEKNVK